MNITYEKREEKLVQHVFEIPDDTKEVFLAGRNYNGAIYYGLYNVEAGGQCEVIVGREHIRIDHAPHIRIRIDSCKRFLKDYTDIQVISKERFLCALEDFNKRTRPREDYEDE